ncbi:MAG: hypothetical protein ABI337_06900 [Nitrososphaera sp.]|jgi:hypothetical protein
MKHKQNTSCDATKIKILALVVAASLLFSMTAVQVAHADHTKEKKQIKKESKDKKINEKKIKKEIKKPSQKKPVVITETRTSANTIESQLKACKEKQTEREQYECEKQIKTQQELETFKQKSTKYQVGPITFYYAGAKVEKSGGKDIVNLRFLVENTGSKDNVTLYCTGPAVCNYDVSDGKTIYKYSSQDFTNGQVVLKPGQSRYINMLFGPAIGYGSYVDFKFDPTKQYTFNIREPWGSASIPLNLQ